MYHKDRKRMLAAVARANDDNPKHPWIVKSFQHPADGNLYVDTLYREPSVRSGFPNARKVLVVVSGVHGIEGPAGSMVQRLIVKRKVFEHPPWDTGILLVHSLNPWGHAHGRRVDHENVDVNRNADPDFVTRSCYDVVAGLLEPERWGVEEHTRLLDTCHEARGPEQLRTLQSMVTSGQHDWPRGLFYGGNKSSWSVETLRRICRDYLSDASQIAVIDIHTGLGEYAKGDILSPAVSPNDDLAERTKRWLGMGIQFPQAERGRSISSPVTGDILEAMIRWLSDKEVTPVTLEMGGTIGIPESLLRLVAENWVYHHPGALSRAEEKRIKQELLEVCYPSRDTFWQRALWNRFLNIAESMLVGLEGKL